MTPGSRHSIGSDASAYRRGVILGMTMAEIFLLLVFCLLIAAAVLFQKNQQTENALAEEAAQQQLRIEELESTVGELEQIVDGYQSASGSVPPTEHWRKLIDDQVKLKRAEDAGLDISRLTERADDILTLQPLLNDAVDGVAVAEHFALAERFLSARDAQGLNDLDPEQVVELAQTAVAANTDGASGHDWPPIVSLSEARGFSFETGKAELSPAFRAQLDGPIIDRVARIVRQYDANVVEVVGHTDELNLPVRVSNLDQTLFEVLDSERPINSLSPADNTGLGMARAVSVARLLRRDPRLGAVTVLPLSAGQLVQPGDSLSEGLGQGDDAERRRIEIRVRRPGSE